MRGLDVYFARHSHLGYLSAFPRGLHGLCHRDGWEFCLNSRTIGW